MNIPLVIGKRGYHVLYNKVTFKKVFTMLYVSLHVVLLSNEIQLVSSWMICLLERWPQLPIYWFDPKDFWTGTFNYYFSGEVEATFASVFAFEDVIQSLREYDTENHTEKQF